MASSGASEELQHVPPRCEAGGYLKTMDEFSPEFSSFPSFQQWPDAHPALGLQRQLKESVLYRPTRGSLWKVVYGRQDLLGKKEPLKQM